MPSDPGIPYQELTYQTIGAAVQVHSRLGASLHEEHCHRALSHKRKNLLASKQVFTQIAQNIYSLR